MQLKICELHISIQIQMFLLQTTAIKQKLDTDVCFLSLWLLLQVVCLGEDLTCRTGGKPDPHVTLNRGAASTDSALQLKPF